MYLILLFDHFKFDEWRGMPLQDFRIETDNFDTISYKWVLYCRYLTYT